MGGGQSCSERGGGWGGGGQSCSERGGGWGGGGAVLF